MPHDEALALAQILLGLLLFTVGIPALIIEIRVDEPLRRLLHKRIQAWPMIVLGVLTLLLVVALITSADEPIKVETLLRLTGAGVTAGFAAVWVYIYRNVRISIVIKSIVNAIDRKFGRNGAPSEPDISDLITLGGHLRGAEKNDVLVAIGELMARVHKTPAYNGTRLIALIHGIPTIVEANGTLDHHNTAMQVISTARKALIARNLDHDKDADALREAACVLGTLAVSRGLQSVALRWVTLFGSSAEVPYRIGTTAIAARAYGVATAALNQLTQVAHSGNGVPKELTALVAQFHAAGPSAGQAADNVTRSLAGALRAGGAAAAAKFRTQGDYSTADAIESYMAAPPRTV